MGSDHGLGLRNEELTMVIEEPVNGLQHLARGKVEFIENDPVAVPDGFDEHSLLEMEAPFIITAVVANVLLQISVLMIIDPHTPSTHKCTQVLHSGSLSA